MECPKCGYKRKSKETVPDDQCPSCGVYYAKVPNPEFPQARQTIVYTQKKSFPLGTLVLCVAALAAGIFVVPKLWMKVLPAEMAAFGGELYAPDGRTLVRDLDMREVRITMYSLTTCGYCTQLRHVFEANNIPFREVFLDTDQARLQELTAKLQQAGIMGGAIGTPTLEVNGKMMPNNPPLAEIVREVAAYARKG
jgi:glutaredoxin